MSLNNDSRNCFPKFGRKKLTVVFSLIALFSLVFLSLYTVNTYADYQKMKFENQKLINSINETKTQYFNLLNRLGGLEASCIDRNLNLAEAMHDLNIKLLDCVSNISLDYSGRIVISTKDGKSYTNIGCEETQIRKVLMMMGSCERKFLEVG